MSWADYQPGRRVVCVTDFGKNETLRQICTVLPVKGRVYTTRETKIGQSSKSPEDLGLMFVEFRSFARPHHPRRFVEGEVSWAADEFKPLDETRLDVFRRMLAPSRQGVVA